VRPLGDVVVLMPPLTISKGNLQRLVHAVGASIQAVFAATHGEEQPTAELAQAA
jgi:adenosylmethionine-8-amino-7-oxononanoate aminotransferase